MLSVCVSVDRAVATCFEWVSVVLGLLCIADLGVVVVSMCPGVTWAPELTGLALPGRLDPVGDLRSYVDPHSQIWMCLDRKFPSHTTPLQCLNTSWSTGGSLLGGEKPLVFQLLLFCALMEKQKNWFEKCVNTKWQDSGMKESAS